MLQPRATPLQLFSLLGHPEHRRQDVHHPHLLLCSGIFGRGLGVDGDPLILPLCVVWWLPVASFGPTASLAFLSGVTLYFCPQETRQMETFDAFFFWSSLLLAVFHPGG